MDKPTIIKGGVSVDDRGRVTFCNDFDMSRVKRFYMLENHQQGFIRAWHGHLQEAKWVVCVSGVAVEAAMELDEPPEFYHPDITVAWTSEDSPTDQLFAVGKPSRYILYPNGDVLYIPPGYANGHMNLVQGTRVLHFSDKTLEEAKHDDYRFDASIHGWVWKVRAR